MTPQPRARRPRRSALRWSVSILLNLLLLEVLSAATIHFFPGLFGGLAASSAERTSRLQSSIRLTLEDRPDSLAQYDSELGWRPRPGLSNSNGDIINHDALRSQREYMREPGPGVLRIAAFGDSFVYGSQVGTNEAWTSVLERNRPHTEVLNYGVPGYGQDQIYLRFQMEARALAPEVVLFGVATPTLDRILTVYPPFRALQPPTVGAMTKPRFQLDKKGELELVSNPMRRLSDLERFLDRPAELRELGRMDYWYEPLVYESWLFDHSYTCSLLFAGWAKVGRRYLDHDRPLCGPPGRGIFNEESTAFSILTRILAGFERSARAFGMRPVVLILPDGFSVQASRDGHSGITDPARAFCEKESLEVMDAGNAFRALPAGTDLDALFVNRFHYSVEGNRIVAEWLRAEIERRGW